MSGADPWPEVERDGNGNAVGSSRKGEVKWGEGLRNDDEEYMHVLKTKLEKLQQTSDGRPPPRTPSSPNPISDFLDSSSISSHSSSPTPSTSQPTLDPSIEPDDPGLPLLWDQPSLPAPTHTPSRRASLDPPSSLAKHILSHPPPSIRFSPRVHISSGVHSTPTRPRRTSFPGPPSPSSASAASSVSVSLRDNSRVWLFPNAILSAARNDTDDAGDYFSIPRQASAASSLRRASIPYDEDEESFAAAAARARAEEMLPSPLLPNHRPRQASRLSSLTWGRGEQTSQKIKTKSEEEVIFGPWRRRIWDWRWWVWKVGRWVRGVDYWLFGIEEEEEGERRGFR